MADNVGLAFNCVIVLKHFLVYSVSPTLLHALKNPLFGLCSKQKSKFLKTIWSDTHLISMTDIFPIGCHCSQLGQSEEKQVLGLLL